jgi:hypothetical protein
METKITNLMIPQGILTIITFIYRPHKNFEFKGFDYETILDQDSRFSSNSSRDNLRKSAENHMQKVPKLIQNYSYSIIMNVTIHISICIGR